MNIHAHDDVIVHRSLHLTPAGLHTMEWWLLSKRSHCFTRPLPLVLSLWYTMSAWYSRKCLALVSHLVVLHAVSLRGNEVLGTQDEWFLENCKVEGFLFNLGICNRKTAIMELYIGSHYMYANVVNVHYQLKNIYIYIHVHVTTDTCCKQKHLIITALLSVLHY